MKEMWTVFDTEVHDIINTHVPIISNSSESKPKWLNAKTKSLFIAAISRILRNIRRPKKGQKSHPKK